MPVLERLIDADAFLDMQHLPEYRDNEYELIQGEMVKMTAPGFAHGELAGEICYYLRQYAKKHKLGRVAVESGLRSAFDPALVLRPDVSFTRHARAPQPGDRGLNAVMPDLAVEIASPSDTLSAMREKAALYLRNGARLVWLVILDEERVEAHSSAGEFQSLGISDALTGGDVLPGFRLDLGRLFDL
ncbi:MAG: Uma2 family endonuclease [Chloroflexi bacterium]|nr:Uma2 family endonuclease [Chloroflexota bacterium]MCY4247415.1 Uma2 family endonuclease [Chloroflexota bacterium]